jgi:hypothetical protein
MTSEERVTTVLNGGIPDRVPYQDAFWATTIERWRTEGLPSDISPSEYFGCEFAHLGGDYSLQLPIENLEQTDNHHIYHDENGATRKDLNTADGWTPGWLEFAIKNRGYIFHTDHSVPNNVSFENYQFARDMLKKYGQYN